MCVYNWREGARKTEPGSFQWCPMTGQEAVGTHWNTRCSVWPSGNTFLLVGWLSTGTGYPERLWWRSGAQQKNGLISFLSSTSVYYWSLGQLCSCIVALYMGFAVYPQAQEWIHGNMGWSQNGSIRGTNINRCLYVNMTRYFQISLCEAPVLPKPSCIWKW